MLRLDCLPVFIITFRIGCRSVPTEHRACHHSLALCGRYVELSVKLVDERFCFAMAFDVVALQNVGFVVAAFSFFDNAYLVFGLYINIALFGQRGTQRNDLVAVTLHYLGKLTNMIEIAVNFKMTVINISASTVFMGAVGIGYSDTVAVGNTEQLLVMRIDKADTASCAFEVMVKPILAVTISVEIIFALMGIEPHKVGVILRIHSHAVISACTVTLAKL